MEFVSIKNVIIIISSHLINILTDKIRVKNIILITTNSSDNISVNVIGDCEGKAIISAFLSIKVFTLINLRLY